MDINMYYAHTHIMHACMHSHVYMHTRKHTELYCT